MGTLSGCSACGHYPMLSVSLFSCAVCDRPCDQRLMAQDASTMISVRFVQGTWAVYDWTTKNERRNINRLVKRDIESRISDPPWIDSLIGIQVNAAGSVTLKHFNGARKRVRYFVRSVAGAYVSADLCSFY